MKVIKRNGEIVDFDLNKIENAMKKAFVQLGIEFDEVLCKRVESKIKEDMSVEDIQDVVVKTLMDSKYKDVAIAYQSYRAIRTKERKEFDDLMGVVEGIYTVGSDDNSNKPSHLRNVKRDMVAGEVEKIQASRHIPKRIYEAHLRKDMHWHDEDYSGDIPMTNCCIPDVWDMLHNGTRINNADVENPNSLMVATTVLSQIVANIAHQEYGGISISDFNEGLAEYAKKTFNKNFKYNCEYEGLKHFYADGDSIDIPVTHEKAFLKAMEKTKKDIYDACQTYEYQSNSISSASQTPFSTIMFNIPTSWESKEITKAYFEVRKNGLGKKKKIAVFPKLNYVVVDGLNLKESDIHYDLTVEASKCIAKCFYPDILNYSIEDYENRTIYSRMGCRSRVDHDYRENGLPVRYGRLNTGVISANIVNVALQCLKDGNTSEEYFFEKLKERSLLMEEAIKYRFDYVCKMKAKDAPILFKYGAICRREDEDTLEDIFRSSRASFSYGFVGIDDCVRLLKNNKTILDNDGREFGLKIIQFLNDEAKRIKNENNIPVSLYATPFEKGIHSLYQADKKRYFDVMPEWLKEREYYTNSYHFSSELPTDAFSKVGAEAEFVKFANGGNIVYSEIGAVRNNTDAIIELIQYGNEIGVQYQAFNVRASKCYCCGYEGDIKYDETLSKYKCPNCNNTDNKTMSIIMRCCGYLSDYDERQAVKGRVKEMNNRAIHVGDSYENNLNK